MSEARTSDLRLEDLDLQGYSLWERLRGIALIQDPVCADIVRYAAQEIERHQTAEAPAIPKLRLRVTARTVREYNMLKTFMKLQEMADIELALSSQESAISIAEEPSP